MANAEKTVRLQESTHRRLTEAKPYDSMTYDEYITQLLNFAEAKQ